MGSVVTAIVGQWLVKMSTTPKRRKPSIRRATKPSPLDRILFDWPTRWDTYELNRPRLARPFLAGSYVTIGFCGICLREIEAVQPGGTHPRHRNDQSPICSEKRRIE